MSSYETWNIVLSGGTLFFTFLVGLLAALIALAQYQLNNYTEIFIYPSFTDSRAAIQVHNASVFPIYIESYTLSSSKTVATSTQIGGNSIPNNPESWYTILIPEEIQKIGNFELITIYKTYKGELYSNKTIGVAQGASWNVTTFKSSKI